MPVVERPADINRRIAQLLAGGDAWEFKCTELGKFLRQFMTAAELDYAYNSLPVNDPVGFDGRTCDLCRGDTRFLRCRICQGEFSEVGVGGQRMSVFDAECQAAAVRYHAVPSNKYAWLKKVWRHLGAAYSGLKEGGNARD